ncbi:acyl carrier protein [Labilibaculum antarcticum]|uniref:Carrier domain-containing protein n=1 Tax=Labilibaculum antarcticum TaxID=1717717 RepID=A0A1Y1CRK1_9BACT|nr:acyl carrier protein [Labilibaculum antarcticum]BAX82623.1 hypothetical protein ALGA_4333 [Labilibaculum antarcticum]
MKENDFILKIKEELEIDEPLSTKTRFDSLEIWDSMARLILISLVDEQFQIQMNAEDFKVLLTPEDLINKIGVDHFDGYDLISNS